QVLVAPLAGDGALLKNALADVKPSYLALAYPHGARALAEKAALAARDFASSMAKNLGVELVEVPSVGFVDAVAAVRRGVVHVKAVAKGILEVHVALFDNAPTWLNTVLLYASSVVDALVYEGIGLSGVSYYSIGVEEAEELPRLPKFTELNPTEYFVLRLIAEGRHTAVEIHDAFNRQFGSISRQMINAALARLRDRGLVEVHGGGSTFIYRLTEAGRLIAG
ncbi:MAG: winged helix-turn-helix domain-containing protein, partial [Caldivirga sp.]|nr:winged helix-turn-helix domain-containing protein [Caldivirga sp.]